MENGQHIVRTWVEATPPPPIRIYGVARLPHAIPSKELGQGLALGMDFDYVLLSFIQKP